MTKIKRNAAHLQIENINYYFRFFFRFCVSLSPSHSFLSVVGHVTSWQALNSFTQRNMKNIFHDRNESGKTWVLSTTFLILHLRSTNIFFQSSAWHDLYNFKGIIAVICLRQFTFRACIIWYAIVGRVLLFTFFSFFLSFGNLIRLISMKILLHYCTKTFAHLSKFIMSVSDSILQKKTSYEPRFSNGTDQ